MISVCVRGDGQEILEDQVAKQKSQFQRLVTYLAAKDPRLSDKALVKIKAYAATHPDWTKKLDPEGQVAVKELITKPCKMNGEEGT